MKYTKITPQLAMISCLHDPMLHTCEVPGNYQHVSMYCTVLLRASDACSEESSSARFLSQRDLDSSKTGGPGGERPVAWYAAGREVRCAKRGREVEMGLAIMAW